MYGERCEVRIVKLSEVSQRGPVEAVEGNEGEREGQSGHLLDIAGSHSTHPIRGVCQALLQLSVSLTISLCGTF